MSTSRLQTFDGDGVEDILWSGFDDYLWLMHTTMGAPTVTRIRFDGDAQPISGDFDGDGLGDVYWYTRTSAPSSWPAADGYENNDSSALAKEISERSDSLTPFGPSGNTRFHHSADRDFFMWDDFSNEIPPRYVMCRLMTDSPAMSADLYLGYRRSGDPAWPYLHDDSMCSQPWPRSGLCA